MAWISASEHLPEMKEQYRGGPLQSASVLIFNGYYVTLGRYAETYTKRIRRWEDIHGRLTTATHWQPLPAPPEKP